MQSEGVWARGGHQKELGKYAQGVVKESVAPEYVFLRALLQSEEERLGICVIDQRDETFGLGPVIHTHAQSH